MNSKGPLAGIRVLVTRPVSQAPAFCRLLEGSGAQVIAVPTIEIADPPDWAPADSAIAALGSYVMAIFTSANGVRRMVDRLGTSGRSASDLERLKLVAIGPMTARELTRLGLEVSIVPDEYRAEALIEAVSVAAGGRLDGMRVLLPRALEAREVLPEGLRRLGALLDVVPVYQAVVPTGARDRVEAALQEGVDLLTFTSSSTVRNFMQLGDAAALQRRLQGVAIGCIGPITAATAAGLGLSVAIQPRDYTIEAFHQAVLDYFALAGGSNLSSSS